MSWAVWITGPPGSGKSTLARTVAARLGAAGTRAAVLELDAMRRIVTPSPTYSDAERDLVYRALVWVAATLVGAGVPVIVDATAPTRADLVIDTERTPVDEAAAQVCGLAGVLPAPKPPRTAEGWTIWITGLPGSGKTTIAGMVAETLADYGVAVRVLELGDLLGFIAGCSDSPLAELIAHRTLVYAAKVLCEVGVPVIVDATAPVRAWREPARALIPHFAEVQLQCPPDVCATRERAVRWRLMGCAHMPPRRERTRPDIALAYEPSLRPDLIIHTDVGDPQTAAADVVTLARRLHRASCERSWIHVLAG